MKNNIQQQIDNLEKRVKKLESLMLRVRVKKQFNLKKEDGKCKKIEYSGPKGGVLLLIEEGFLETTKTTNEVWTELKKKAYIYQRDVIQTTLNRLSKSTGPLVKMEEKGKKVYAQRK